MAKDRPLKQNVIRVDDKHTEKVYERFHSFVSENSSPETVFETASVLILLIQDLLCHAPFESTEEERTIFRGLLLAMLPESTRIEATDHKGNISVYEMKGGNRARTLAGKAFRSGGGK